MTNDEPQMTKEIRNANGETDRHSAAPGSRHLNPACSKCRSVVNASVTPASPITMKLAQSTSPHVLSGRSVYRSNARARKAALTRITLASGVASSRRTASRNRGREVVRARLFPVSATIQSVRRMGRRTRPSCCQISFAGAWSVSRELSSATQPFESRKKASAAIRYLRVTVQIVVEVDRKVGDASVCRQFCHSPHRVEFLVRDLRGRSLCCRRRLRLYPDRRAFGQFGTLLQYHNSISDCPFVTHSSQITYTPFRTPWQMATTASCVGPTLHSPTLQ